MSHCVNSEASEVTSFQCIASIVEVIIGTTSPVCADLDENIFVASLTGSSMVAM